MAVPSIPECTAHWAPTAVQQHPWMHITSAVTLMMRYELRLDTKEA